jgi:hypothetical protein
MTERVNPLEAKTLSGILAHLRISGVLRKLLRLWSAD